MSFKRWPHPKTGSRTRLGSMESQSTINTLAKDCIMLNGDCDCFVFEDCKFKKDVAILEKRKLSWGKKP